MSGTRQTKHRRSPPVRYPRRPGVFPGLALVLVTALICACSGRQGAEPVWVETSGDAGPATDDPDAAVDFARAVELYEAGAFVAALEALRLFGAEFAADPLAVRAEIYLGRTQAALGQTLDADRTFRSLHAAPDSEVTRVVAALYVAFVAALRGELDHGLDVLTAELRRDPDMGIPGPWIVPGDGPLLGTLLAEAQVAADLPLGAIRSLAFVAAGDDPELALYAAERCVALADNISDDGVLWDAAYAPDGFAVACATGALVSLLAAEGDLEGARDLLARGEPEMLAHGLERRAVVARHRVSGSATGATRAYGVALSLTGPTRRAGRAALGAILLAQRAFEVREAESVVLIRDTGGTVDGTRRAVAELAAAGASAIVGPIEADLAEEARTAANEVGVALLSLSPVPFDSPVAGTWRWLVDARQEAIAVVELAVSSRGAERFVIVSEPPAQATTFLAAFAAAASMAIDTLGATRVDDIALVSDPEDPSVLQASARLAAERVAAAEVDAVVLALPDAAAATLVAWLASENVWPASGAPGETTDGRRRVVYLANSFVATDALLRNSSTYMEGALLPYWFLPEIATGEGREFADRFAYTFGRNPGTVEAFAFDAAVAMRRLILDEGIRGRAEVIRRIDAGVDAGVVVGPLRFDIDGNPSLSPRFATVRGDRFVAVD